MKAFDYPVTPLHDTNTQVHKYKVLERPNMCYIFKSKGFKDIKYDNTNCVTQRLTSRPKKWLGSIDIFY